MEKGEEFKSLDDVLGAIRTAEAVADHQDSVVGSTNDKDGKVIKCFNCDKIGHKVSSCLMKKSGKPEKPAVKPTNQNFGCGFYGGKEGCSYKNCRAYKMKCNQCHKYGHISKCFNVTTRPRARDNLNNKIRWVDKEETEDKGVNSLQLGQQQQHHGGTGSDSSQRQMKCH